MNVKSLISDVSNCLFTTAKCVCVIDRVCLSVRLSHPRVSVCVDIDECDMFNNLCINGRCENVMGYFQCTCAPGYKLDHTGGNCTGRST